MWVIWSDIASIARALVEDNLMPIITFFIPGCAWREATLTLGPILISLGHIIGALVDFLIIALVVFIIMKQIEKTPMK